MSEQVDKQLADEALEAYVDWREECAGVWDAYERWARAPKIDAAVAFSAYRAALDREECASHAYADLLVRLRRGKGAAFVASRPQTVATANGPVGPSP
jgi:hypothetical protein